MTRKSISFLKRHDISETLTRPEEKSWLDLFNTQALQKTTCALESKSSVNNLQYKVWKHQIS